MAILWPFLAIRATLMAPTLMPHEYLLPPMIWAEFYHFRISGSIVCRQLLHSFTDVMKGASPFVTLGQVCWCSRKTAKSCYSSGEISYLYTMYFLCVRSHVFLFSALYQQFGLSYEFPVSLSSCIMAYPEVCSFLYISYCLLVFPVSKNCFFLCISCIFSLLYSWFAF